MKHVRSNDIYECVRGLAAAGEDSVRAILEIIERLNAYLALENGFLVEKVLRDLLGIACDLRMRKGPRDARVPSLSPPTDSPRSREPWWCSGSENLQISHLANPCKHWRSWLLL